MTHPIVAFIEARYDEEQAIAEAAAADAGSPDAPAPEWRDRGGIVTSPAVIAAGIDGMDMDASASAHIARHDPAHVLADLAAKRSVVKLHGADERGRCRVCLTDRAGRPQEDWDADPYPCDTIKLSAAPYAAHSDHLAKWAIEG